MAAERDEETQEAVDLLKAMVPDAIDVLFGIALAASHASHRDLAASKNARGAAVINANRLIDKIVDFAER